MFDTYDVEEFLQEEQTFSVDAEAYTDSYGILPTGDMDDDQEWLSHNLMSHPMSTMGSLPEKTIVRKTGHLGYNWGPSDYKQMSEEVYTTPTVVEVQSPTVIDHVSTGHTRVQVTFYKHSQYQKGNSGNFELRQDIDEVFNRLQNLITIYPKQKKPEQHVRVQLQNKDKNQMKGGKNFSLHNADIPRVMELLTKTFEDLGWLKPDPQSVFTVDPSNISKKNIVGPCRDDVGTPVAEEVLNIIEHSNKKTIHFSTEDGSPEPKPLFSCGGPKGTTDCVQDFSEISVQKPGVTQRAAKQDAKRRDIRVVEAEKEILKLIGVDG